MESRNIGTLFSVLVRCYGFDVHDALQIILKKEYGGIRPFARAIGLSHTSVYGAIRNPSEISNREKISKFLGFNPWAQNEAGIEGEWGRECEDSRERKSQSVTHC
jgi:hypothetical protein